MMPSSRALRPPSSRRPLNSATTSVSRAASLETSRFILLMQAGWVAVGLIAVASFPPQTSVPPAPLVKLQTDASKPANKGVPQPLKATTVVANPAVLFANGSESLVARTVGHAEGTRTPDGIRTPAYFGHADPGNGVWNLGSFSFQHCREARYNCSTPEQADGFQLQRLQTQAAMLRQRSQALGLQVTLEEELNAIDLANQAPLAALGKPGYADYLAKVKKQGLKGQDAVLEARVWSFWNPQGKQWDAPGLGNTEADIRHDQNRRMLAISRVLAVYAQLSGAPSLAQRWQNWLSAQQASANPYSYQTQRSQYLWWDAGYWDSKRQRGRQVPESYESAYDQGFQRGNQ